MLLLPYENYNLYSSLPIERLRGRLEGNLQPDRIVPSPEYDKPRPYIGDSGEKEFRIYRRVQYRRNADVPIVTGEYFQEGVISRIHIRIQMRFTTWVVLLIVLTVSVYIGVKFQELLTPLGLLAFIYFANLIAFKIESYQAKEFLLALFEAQKTKP